MLAHGREHHLGDAEIVEERAEILVHVLQSFLARRGRGGADTIGAGCEAAVATLSTLSSRARTAGWAITFDDAITSLRTLATTAHGDERDELGRVAASLGELDPVVLRLARRDLRVTTTKGDATRAKSRLRQSLGVPALHPDPRSAADTAKGVVEPRATEQLRRSARDAVEEIASLFWLRHPADDMPWATGAAFDARMLMSLDACAAYERGRASIDVELLALKIARDFPIVDAARWFAALFVLACTDGERPMNALRQVLLELPEDALVAGVDALALGSNPRLARVARSLLDEDDRPRALRIGLEALERIGASPSFDAAAVLPLLEHPDDRIASLAAILLARGEPKDVAPALAQLLDRPGVALAASRSLAMRGAEVGPSFLRQSVARGIAASATDDEIRAGGAAARVLAFVGAARDEAALAQAALHAPDTEDGDATIEALADHGAPSFVPLLAQIVKSASSTASTREDRTGAASRTIERLTGVAPERDPAEPWRLDVEAQVTRAEAFRPPLGAARVRRGRKLDVTTARAELLALDTRTAERRRAAVGLSFLLGRPIDLDTEGWVARQLDVLRAAQTLPDGGAAT